VTKQGKILIADDDALFLQTTTAVLEKAGFLCSGVADAAAAIELVSREQFDLLIADIQMPGNSQLELLQSLQTASFNLPIIVVTGYPSLYTAIQSVQLQIVAYLIKPFDVSQFLLEVQRAILRSRIQKSMLGLQGRWRTWGEELLASAEAMPPTAATNQQALEALLNVSLRNLAHCIADVQEIRQVLSRDELNASSKEVVALSQREALAALAAVGTSREEKQPSLHATFERARLSASLREELRQLSRREREVLRLLLANHKPQSIAQKLFISLHTVRNHLRSIFEKLGVHSQTELLSRFGRYDASVDLPESA